MAQEFIRKHALSALSTVSGAIDQLMSKELIYKGVHGYVVYDYLLAEYLRACRSRHMILVGEWPGFVMGYGILATNL